MQEIATCPLCGKKPYPYHYEEDHIEYVHCGVKCEDEGTWNRYAAAMEFSIAESWEEETDNVREWLDVSTDNADAYNEIVDININAERAVFAAREASNEVFK